MKLKILLCALFIPLLAHGANTNVFDRVLIRSTLQFPVSPGLNKVATSDAAGFFSWVTPDFTAANAITNFTIDGITWFTVSGQGTHTIGIATNSTQIPIINGGTGSNTASGARSNLGAAGTPINSDITSMTVLGTIVGPFTVTNAVTILGPSIINTGTNAVMTLTVNGVSGTISPTTVTNVVGDFPNILAASFADLTFPVSQAITNMPVTLGRAASESSSLITQGIVVSNGFVTIRACNVGSLAVDQASSAYQIRVVLTP